MVTTRGLYLRWPLLSDATFQTARIGMFLSEDWGRSHILLAVVGNSEISSKYVIAEPSVHAWWVFFTTILLWQGVALCRQGSYDFVGWCAGRTRRVIAGENLLDEVHSSSLLGNSKLDSPSSFNVIIGGLGWRPFVIAVPVSNLQVTKSIISGLKGSKCARLC